MRHMQILTAVLFITNSLPAEEKPQEIPADLLKIFEHAESVEFFSMNAQPVKADEMPEFHGWQVLGKTHIEKKERQVIVQELTLALEKNGLVSRCFFPRHGLRFTQGDRQVDLVICFQCNWVKIYANDQEEEQNLFIAAGPRGRFNEILRRANVTLP